MTPPGTSRLSAGMVGGGFGADIGKTHRYAMRLDDRFTLDAGVFGRDPGRSAAMAAELGVPVERVYQDHREMAEAEARRADGIDLAVVATPNDSHFEVARSFLEAGIAVAEPGVPHHSAAFAEAALSEKAHGAVLAAAKGLAMTAIDILANPSLLSEATAEFRAGPGRPREG